MNGPFRAGLVCVLVTWVAAAGTTPRPAVRAPLRRGRPVRAGRAAAAGVLGDGTILDPVSNTCVLDDGGLPGRHGARSTSTCQDPTSGLTVDVIRGPSPTAFGVGGEASLIPAGQHHARRRGRRGVSSTATSRRSPTATAMASPSPTTTPTCSTSTARRCSSSARTACTASPAGFVAVGDAAGLDRTGCRFGVEPRPATRRAAPAVPARGRALPARDRRLAVRSWSTRRSATPPPRTTSRSTRVRPATRGPADRDAGGTIDVASTIAAMATRRYAVPLGTGQHGSR